MEEEMEQRVAGIIAEVDEFDRAHEREIEEDRLRDIERQRELDELESDIRGEGSDGDDEK